MIEGCVYTMGLDSKSNAESIVFGKPLTPEERKWLADEVAAGRVMSTEHPSDDVLDEVAAFRRSIFVKKINESSM